MLERLAYEAYYQTSVEVPYRPRLNWFWYSVWKYMHLGRCEMPEDEETLLEIAQGLEGEALDAWLESLSPEEKKELWAQNIVAIVDVVLPQIIALFGPPPKEAADGEVSDNAE